ncbi:MAG: hypothetical protein M0P72_03325 [Metallibacterium scheffleri]|jgi:hypothetical protein|uniref:hypothetical protein n=1 Tax=Metallibacterium scheffleri TaxID=993689 RepID=UPI0026EA836A|nr:hypothetical protein [Metallibacterium scheffleri]MCK9366165.1 hypothetical protein [Metallibacterium scheffleri]
MKQLDNIFMPDEASLDPAIASFLGCTKDAWKAYEQAMLAKRHQEIAAMACQQGVPAHIRRDVELSRNLLLYSFFVYEFATAAAHYAAIALEAALRRALGKNEACRDNLDTLLREAVAAGMLSSADHEYVTAPHFVSESRNGLAHAKEDRDVFNYALALPFVEMTIRAINALFPDDLSAQSS